MSGSSLKSPDELERDIALTRAGIDRRLSVFSDRMSRDAMVDWTIQYLNRRGVGFFSGFGRAVRDNPVPSLMVGAGLAWLISESRRPARASRPLPAPATERVSPHRSAGVP